MDPTHVFVLLYFTVTWIPIARFSQLRNPLIKTDKAAKINVLKMSISTCEVLEIAVETGTLDYIVVLKSHIIHRTHTLSVSQTLHV